MGLAVPLIGAAVGVAGTVSSVRAQNQQVAQQNAAISAQISANEQSEQIRKLHNEAQQQLMKRSYQTERIARKTSFIEEKNNLRSLQLQSRLGQRQQIQQTKTADAQTQVQADFAQQQVEQALAQAEQSTDENRIQIMDQLSSALSQIPDPTPEIKDAQRQIQNSIAQVITSTGGRGRTGAVQRSQDEELLSNAISAIQQGNQISAEAAQQLALSEDFNSLISSIANAAAGLQTQSIGLSEVAQLENSALARDRVKLQGKQFRNQIKGARNLSKISNKIGNKQASINYDVAKGGLISGMGLSQAQAAAQSAQLVSNVQRGPSGLSAATGIISNLLPLAGLIGTGSQSQSPASVFSTGGNIPITNDPFIATPAKIQSQTTTQRIDPRFSLF